MRHADGRQLQQVGLQPKILVRPTIKGTRAGKDEVLLNRQEVNCCTRDKADLLQHANSKQCEQIALLEQQVDLLKQRLEQYEVTFSAESFNHVRRLN